jgi:hypothetical protein
MDLQQQQQLLWQKAYTDSSLWGAVDISGVSIITIYTMSFSFTDSFNLWILLNKQLPTLKTFV